MLFLLKTYKLHFHTIFSLFRLTVFIFPFQNLPDLNVKIRQARQNILRFFNTNEDAHSVIFTSGATQSLKIVIENYKFQENEKFFYLKECHTSAVGLRELVKKFEILDKKTTSQKLSSEKGGIFAFPAMSNFNGEKFLLENWIQKAHDNGIKVLLDAASFVSTNYLDLSKIHADYICLSFYKIFGLPTGLGALIVKNSSLKFLKKLDKAVSFIFLRNFFVLPYGMRVYIVL